MIDPAPAMSRACSILLLLVLVLFSAGAGGAESGSWIGNSFLEVEIQRFPREFRRGEVMNVMCTLVGDGRALAVGATAYFLVYINKSPLKDEHGAPWIHQFPPLNVYNESGYALQVILTDLKDGIHLISVGLLDLDPRELRVIHENQLDFTVVGNYSRSKHYALGTAVSKCMAASPVNEECRDYLQLRLLPLSPFLTRTELVLLKSTSEKYFTHLIDEGLLEMVQGSSSVACSSLLSSSPGNTRATPLTHVLRMQTRVHPDVPVARCRGRELRAPPRVRARTRHRCARCCDPIQRCSVRRSLRQRRGKPHNPQNLALLREDSGVPACQLGSNGSEQRDCHLQRRLEA
eukprot:752218-Hanusia_phi.AAC.9